MVLRALEIVIYLPLLGFAFVSVFAARVVGNLAIDGTVAAGIAVYILSRRRSAA